MNEQPSSPAVTTADELRQRVQADPNADIFYAVAKGEITVRQAEALMRRRKKDAKRPQPIRHFKSLFSADHMNRHERRARAAKNRHGAAPPLPVGSPGIVFKAAWPPSRADRLKIKVAQRRIRGTAGGSPRPLEVSR